MKSDGKQLEPTQSELNNLVSRIEKIKLPADSKEIRPGDATSFVYEFRNCSTRHGCQGAANCNSCYADYGYA